MLLKGDIDQQARDVMMANDQGSYTIPTKGLYPYQWNWDSAMAALGFAEFDLPRAWLELETLFSGQWPNGMVPHIIFHKPSEDYFPGPDVWGGNLGSIPSSGISQPPLASTMARFIYERDPGLGEQRIKELYPKMLAWHKWFVSHRSYEGAIISTHPWESGRDNAPDWDALMQSIDPVGLKPYTRKDTSMVDSSMRPGKFDYDRYLYLVSLGKKNAWDEYKLKDLNPFRIADPGLTFMALRAARDLQHIGDHIGYDTSDLAKDIQSMEDGLTYIWNEDEGYFDARDTRTQEFSGSLTNASFLNWYAGHHSGEMLLKLKNQLSSIPYGVASHDPGSSKFDRGRYWRGPTWAIVNFLIGKGLEEMGHPEGAELRRRTREMMLKGGFSEYFDPITGEPKGGQSFTWTAVVWLVWAGKD